MLWSFKKCQKIGLGRGLGQVRTKDLRAQIILDKIFGTKWNKTGQEKKSFLCVFACFFAAIGKV